MCANSGAAPLVEVEIHAPDMGAPVLPAQYAPMNGED